MDNDTVLHINMLGECSLTYGGNTLNDQTVRSKKIWTLLEYLITFRDRDISQNDLIDLIYPDGKSEQPVNALKTLLHRVRSALDTLGYVDGKEMVIQRRSTYTWNSALNFDVDVDRFETLCGQAHDESLPEAQRLEAYQAAIELYKGDFLPKTSLEPWAAPISTYYHTMYLQIVHEAVEWLREKGQYANVVHICQKAVVIDPYDEFLYYHLILALSDMNRTQAALTQYEEMTKLFYNEFGVTPSKDLQGLYKELVKSSQSVEADLGVVKAHLREVDESVNGAFLCEYEFFKDIYRLEVRSAARSGMPAHLGLFTVSNPTGRSTSVKALNNAMDKLSVCIQGSLRRSDLYARYSVSQFIVLLPATNYENGLKVMERIAKRFKRENPHSPLVPQFSLQAIDSMI